MVTKPKAADVTAHPKPPTSDEIWNIVKYRLSDYLKILRLAAIVLGAVVGVLLAGIVALLALPQVRDQLVQHWIVDVDAKIKAQSVRLDNLEHLIDSYMDRIVAYSYSSSFLLSGNSSSGQRYYNMRYYKSSSDRGKLRCRAAYPNNMVTNAILINFNSQRQRHVLAPAAGQNLLEIDLDLPKGDAGLFDPMISPKAYQNIEFTLDSAQPLDQPVSVDCTLLIIGPARLTTSP